MFSAGRFSSVSTHGRDSSRSVGNLTQEALCELGLLVSWLSPSLWDLIHKASSWQDTIQRTHVLLTLNQVCFATLPLWSSDQQLQHHLGAYSGCRNSGPSPDSLNWNLLLNRISRQFGSSHMTKKHRLVIISLFKGAPSGDCPRWGGQVLALRTRLLYLQGRVGQPEPWLSQILRTPPPNPTLSDDGIVLEPSLVVWFQHLASPTKAPCHADRWPKVGQTEEMYVYQIWVEKTVLPA